VIVAQLAQGNAMAATAIARIRLDTSPAPIFRQGDYRSPCHAAVEGKKYCLAIVGLLDARFHPKSALADFGNY
jgi:hypothetical protein